jgi:hypothetical protein
MDQDGRRPLNFVGEAINLTHALHDAIMQHRQTRGMVVHTSLVTIRVEWFEEDHALDSSTGSCWVLDLQQLPTCCLRSRLPGSYAAAQRKADPKTMVVVEHCLCLVLGEHCALGALSGNRHFQAQKFNHFLGVLDFLSSIRKSALSPFVPVAAQKHRKWGGARRPPENSYGIVGEGH